MPKIRQLFNKKNSGELSQTTIEKEHSTVQVEWIFRLKKGSNPILLDYLISKKLFLFNHNFFRGATCYLNSLF
jgi:hypothetical protein